jgi:hypothetical protein
VMAMDTSAGPLPVTLQVWPPSNPAGRVRLLLTELPKPNTG